MTGLVRTPNASTVHKMIPVVMQSGTNGSIPSLQPISCDSRFPRQQTCTIIGGSNTLKKNRTKQMRNDTIWDAIAHDSLLALLDAATSSFVVNYCAWNSQHRNVQCCMHVDPKNNVWRDFRILRQSIRKPRQCQTLLHGNYRRTAEDLTGKIYRAIVCDDL